jgi:DNA-directed RNA polymerase subunit E'/Rpb7/23S rRNA U2552 (ribose-2'-O)-methylase RlmE/FtsJ
VSQLVKVKINLDPCDLGKDYEKKIYAKIAKKYGDKCHLNGFIKKSSIDIVKIENGSRRGSHLHGFLTFNVEFNALFCVPKRDTKIVCRVKQINKFGIMAHLHPMDVIVPRQLQTYGDIELFKDVHIGSLIQIQALDYTIERDRVVVVGFIVGTNLKEFNMVDLPLDGLLTHEDYNYQIDLQFSDKPPEQDTKYGSNTALNKLKDKITPYNVNRPDRKEKIWQSIKKLINPYELIDKHHTPEQLKKYGLKYNLIKYNNFERLYDAESLYPVITRAFFKLWEVLVETKVLDKYKDIPLRFANLAEGPGGFIQCLIDYRNLQHHSEWKKDAYHAITLKSSGPRSGIQDWEYSEGSAYFEVLQKHQYNVNLSYGHTGNGDLTKMENILHFTQDIVGEKKCQFITADGGIYLSEEQYGAQEYENAKLFFSEILTALRNQDKKGTFIIKIYDIYYHVTIQMIHLLSVYYNNITIIKPRTSRPANSEKYLVCTDFNGDWEDENFVESLGRLDELYETWIKTEDETHHMTKLFDFHEKTESSFQKTIIDFNKYNVDLQMEKINEGLGLAMTGNYADHETEEIYRTNQEDHAKEWCETYQIHHT